MYASEVLQNFSKLCFVLVIYLLLANEAMIRNVSSLCDFVNILRFELSRNDISKTDNQIDNMETKQIKLFTLNKLEIPSATDI